jgi:hypothetical protein
LLSSFYIGFGSPFYLFLNHFGPIWLPPIVVLTHLDDVGEFAIFESKVLVCGFFPQLIIGCSIILAQLKDDA